MDMLQGLRWDLVRDGMLMLLCSAILCAIIARRWMGRRRVAEASPADRPLSFSQEVLLQTVRQQTRQALESILAAVEAERSKLQPLLSAEPPCLPPGSGLAPEHVPFRLGEDDFESGLSGESDPYAAVRSLEASGLSVREIAGQINRPAGEVELALRLRRSAS
jgi:hypothetical protein